MFIFLNTTEKEFKIIRISRYQTNFLNQAINDSKEKLKSVTG